MVSRLCVRMPERILVFDPMTRSQQVFALPDQMKDCSIQAFCSLGRDKAIAICKRKSDGKQWNDVIWMSASGVVTDSKAVLLSSEQIEINDRKNSWLASAVAPSPLAHVIASTLFFPNSMLDTGRAGSYFEALAVSMAAGWPAMVLVCLVGGAVSYITHHFQKKFFRSHSAVWSIVVFLCGPLGLLGYWLHFRRPVLEACSSCDQLAPRDRDACAMCGMEFRPPELLGNEIFA